MQTIPPQDMYDLYREIDETVARLTGIHVDRLRCGPGCCSCCVDDITVFAVEALHIEAHHRELLAHGIPHAAGACAFLDPEGRCRIYEHRPYVCRTQGLPIRWFDEGSEEEIVEMRDICPLNEEGTPIEELPADACWTIGPVEERLAELQHRSTGAAMTRGRLRTLFKNE